MSKEKDIIQKPFFTWLSTLVIVILVISLREKNTTMTDFEFLIFITGVFIGFVAFLITIMRILKEKSIFYFVAMATAFILFFYVLLQSSN